MRQPVLSEFYSIFDPLYLLNLTFFASFLSMMTDILSQSIKTLLYWIDDNAMCVCNNRSEKLSLLLFEGGGVVVQIRP